MLGNQFRCLICSVAPLKHCPAQLSCVTQGPVWIFICWSTEGTVHFRLWHSQVIDWGKTLFVNVYFKLWYKHDFSLMFRYTLLWKVLQAVELGFAQQCSAMSVRFHRGKKQEMWASLSYMSDHYVYLSGGNADWNIIPRVMEGNRKLSSILPNETIHPTVPLHFARDQLFSPTAQ